MKSIHYSDEQWMAVLAACDFKLGEFGNSFEMQLMFENYINQMIAAQPEFDAKIGGKRGRPYRKLVATGLWASAIAFWRDELGRDIGESHDEGNTLYRFVEAISAPLPGRAGITPQAFRQFQRTQWAQSFSRPVELKP